MANLPNCSLKLLGSSKILQTALSRTFEKGWKISKITKNNRICEFGKIVRNCLNSGKFLHIFNPSQICSSCDFEKQSPSKFNHSEPIDLSNTRNCHGLEHREFFYRIIGKSSNKILNTAGPVSDYIIQSEYGATHLSTTERVPAGVG